MTAGQIQHPDLDIETEDGKFDLPVGYYGGDNRWWGAAEEVLALLDTYDLFDSIVGLHCFDAGQRLRHFVENGHGAGCGECEHWAEDLDRVVDAVNVHLKDDLMLIIDEGGIYVQTKQWIEENLG